MNSNSSLLLLKYYCTQTAFLVPTLFSKDPVVQFVAGGPDTKPKDGVRKVFCGRTVKFSVWFGLKTYTRDQMGSLNYIKKLLG